MIRFQERNENFENELYGNENDIIIEIKIKIYECNSNQT